MSETAAQTAARKKKALVSRTDRAIAANDAAESGPAAPAAASPVRKAPRAEAVGTGRSDAQANFDRLVAPLISDEANARKTGNTALADKLATRIAAMKEQLKQAG